MVRLIVLKEIIYFPLKFANFYRVFMLAVEVSGICDVCIV
jgi:hypothetical protein